jgi:hypothetical protein
VKRWLLVSLLLVVGVGCGSDDDDPATGDEPDPDPEAEIALDVEVTADGERSGTIACADTAEGTGFLADPATAEAACELLRTNADVVSRLVDGPPTDLICTDQYGGPEVASVAGQIDGREVDATITRTDGCGIADWTSLEALLGPAS